jgi:hypothetical protein
MSTDAKPELVAALEFQDLFRTDSGNDDSELDDDGASSFSDPVGTLIAKFVDDALGKTVGGVSDSSWDSPMVTPVEECFEKAAQSALSAVKRFVRSNAQLLGSERVDCSLLLKSFREEKCQRQ